MNTNPDLKLELMLDNDKKAIFEFAGKIDDFYAPISGTLNQYPEMWFSHKTRNDLAIEIYVKGDEKGILEDSIKFLNHFYEKQTHYKQLAIKGLINFGNIDWNTDESATTEEDWSLLTLLYYGQGSAYVPNFGLAFYPNQQKWVDVYCQWFVTFYNRGMVGVNRIQW